MDTELRDAYCQLQTANEQSLARFLDKLTSICETEIDGGQALAQSLRTMMPYGIHRRAPVNVPPISDPFKPSLGLFPSPCDTARTSATSRENSKVVSVGTPSGDVFASTPRSKDANMLSQAAGDRQGSPTPSESNAPSAPSQGVHLEFPDLMAAVKEEYGVKLLSYVNERGEVKHPSPSWTKLPGAAFLKKLANCGGSFQPLHKGVFADIFYSNCFHALSVIAILVNFLFIIVQTDWKMSHPDKDVPNAMKVIEIAFTCYYLGELIIGLYVLRKDFFFGQDCGWNLFDLVVVGQAVFEAMMTAAGKAGTKASFLRVLRFLRISKVFRMFNAMRSFKEIKLILDALTGCFNLFVWCSVLLALFLALFGIFFVQGMTTWLETHINDPDVKPELIVDIKTYFSSVSEAMVSLFMASWGGNDWSQYHDVLRQCGWEFQAVFLFYIAFSFIAFANVITGVYAEKAMTLAVPEMHELGERKLDKDVKDAKILVNCCKEVLAGDSAKRTSTSLGSRNPDRDTDYNYIITQNDFEGILAHPEIQKYLAVRGMNDYLARRFFKLLLELHQAESISIGAFVSSVVRINGVASGVDMHCLSAELRRLQLMQDPHDITHTHGHHNKTTC